MTKQVSKNTPSIKRIARLALMASLIGMTTFSCHDPAAKQLQISAKVVVGKTISLSMVGLDANQNQVDYTKSAEWVSSNPSIATVSNNGEQKGLVSGIVVGGPVVITSSLDGTTQQVAVTVIERGIERLEIQAPLSRLPVGSRQKYQVFQVMNDGSSVDVSSRATWTSSNADVATIDDFGQVKTQGVGTVSISALVDGISVSTILEVSNIEVTSIDILVPGGGTSLVIDANTVVFLTAIGHFSDGSSQDITSLVTWSSSAPAIFTISNAEGSKGAVVGIALGRAVATASLGSVTKTISVTVRTLGRV